MARNYIAFRQFSLLWNHYAFIDVPAYLADQLFIKHKVTVHFGEEMGHRNGSTRSFSARSGRRTRNAFWPRLRSCRGKC